ncbi:hypothetical protein, partial [Bifidobacterium animalis]|uniref:hypothetical protein n=1 Tax=Bifidobacterium animalis TaxID=28025 RepID=UPI001D00A4BB
DHAELCCTSVCAFGVFILFFIDFNEAVGMAMRRGGQSDIPEVSQAAARIRPIFETTKARMQELGILPEDIDVV